MYILKHDLYVWLDGQDIYVLSLICLERMDLLEQYRIENWVICRQ